MGLDETLCEGQLPAGCTALACGFARACHPSASSVFFCKLSTDGWILMKLTYMTGIDDGLKLTRGQGSRLKSQGHIFLYVKVLYSTKSS